MRILAGLISLGRFLFGVAFIAEPKLMERAWIGKQARLPGAQLLARAVGARDLTLGLGGLQALTRNDGSARPWLAAAAVCVGRSGDAEPLPSDTHEVKGGAVPSEPVGTV